MKTGMRDRLAAIETTARTLARSGRYFSSASIETVLLARGVPEAHKLFANRWTRAELDRLCEQAIERMEASQRPQAAA